MQLSIWFFSNKSLFYTAEHYTRLFLWQNIWTGTMPWDVEAITAYEEYAEGSVYCTNCTETGSQSKECRRRSVCGENMRGEEGASKKYRQLISWCWNKRINRCIFFMTPNNGVQLLSQNINHFFLYSTYREIRFTVNTNTVKCANCPCETLYLHLGQTFTSNG
jgi:hypothetical protein